jgi:U6 snRNA-associated Sm-like protein LSm7
MSDRPSHRGGRGGGDRGAHRGRGAAAGGRGGSSNAQGERPKKENILDLAKYMDKEIIVKFNGGREGRALPLATRRRSMETSWAAVAVVCGRSS